MGRGMAKAKPSPRQPAGDARPNRLSSLLMVLLTALTPVSGPAVVGSLEVAEAGAVLEAGFATDVAAEASFGAIGTIALVIVGTLLGAVVGMAVLNVTALLYITNLAGVIHIFATASTGSSIGDSMLRIGALVLGIIGPFALLGLAIAVIVVKYRGRKGHST